MFNVYTVNSQGFRDLLPFATIETGTTVKEMAEACAPFWNLRIVVLDSDFVQWYASDKRDETGARLSAEVIASGLYA